MASWLCHSSDFEPYVEGTLDAYCNRVADAGARVTGRPQILTLQIEGFRHPLYSLILLYPAYKSRLVSPQKVFILPSKKDLFI